MLFSAATHLSLYLNRRISNGSVATLSLIAALGLLACTKKTTFDGTAKKQPNAEERQALNQPQDRDNLEDGLSQPVNAPCPGGKEAGKGQGKSTENPNCLFNEFDQRPAERDEIPNSLVPEVVDRDRDLINDQVSNDDDLGLPSDLFDVAELERLRIKFKDRIEEGKEIRRLQEKAKKAKDERDRIQENIELLQRQEDQEKQAADELASILDEVDRANDLAQPTDENLEVILSERQREFEETTLRIERQETEINERIETRRRQETRIEVTSEERARIDTRNRSTRNLSCEKGKWEGNAFKLACAAYEGTLDPYFSREYSYLGFCNMWDFPRKAYRSKKEMLYDIIDGGIALGFIEEKYRYRCGLRNVLSQFFERDYCGSD